MASVFYLSDYLPEEAIHKIMKIYYDKGIKGLDSLYLKHVKDEVKRGDIMRVAKDLYRDETTMIYDGKKFIDLAYGPDDYGSIPPQFLIGDPFPVDHFRDILTHNDYVPFNHNIHKNEIMNNLVAHDIFWTSHVDVNGERVKLLYFTEDTPGGFERRMKKQGFKLDDPKDIYYSYGGIAEDFLYGLIEKQRVKYEDQGYLFYKLSRFH
jgi:hypothetical protein